MSCTPQKMILSTYDLWEQGKPFGFQEKKENPWILNGFFLCFPVLQDQLMVK